MAISGSITYNDVNIVGSNFEVDLNIEGTSDYNIDEYSIKLDNGTWANTTISSPYLTFNDVISFSIPASNTGIHDFFVEFHNENGETSNTYSVDLLLDNVAPSVNTFNLTDIRNNQSENRFDIDLRIILDDEVGISSYGIADTPSTTSSVNVVSDLNWTDLQTSSNTVTFDLTYTNIPNTLPATKRIWLACKDFSGNYSTSQYVQFFVTNAVPIISSFYLDKITQTATDYVIEFKTTVSCSINVIQYQLNLTTDASVWTNFSPISNTYTDKSLFLSIPKSTPAGTKNVDFRVIDDLQNVSGTSTITFELDKTDPITNLTLSTITRNSSNDYLIDCLLQSTDSGDVVAYTIDLNNPNPSSWNTVTPIVNYSNNHIITISSSAVGVQNIYAKTRDFSGNESNIVTLPIEIDNIAPSLDFEFTDIVKLSNSYDITFTVNSSDNKQLHSYAFDVTNGNDSSFNPSNWVLVSGTQRFVYDRFTINIPFTESEGIKTFAFKIKDIFANESVARRFVLDFDKTAPIIDSFVFDLIEKEYNRYKIVTDLDASDSTIGNQNGIVAYRYGWNDISTVSWKEITKSNTVNTQIIEYLPFTEAGNTHDLIVQIKDLFDNTSNTSNLSFTVDTTNPSGNTGFMTARIDLDDYHIKTSLNATDSNSGIMWYSAAYDDGDIRNWTRVPLTNTFNSNTEISIPRTETGIKKIFVYYADMYKNESPAYTYEYDLDDINVVGGVQLNRIEKTSSSYEVYIDLFAQDDKGVTHYKIEENGAPSSWVAIPGEPTSFTDTITYSYGLLVFPEVRNFKIKFKDKFDNESDEYELSITIDKTAPTAQINYLRSSPNFVSGVIDNLDMVFQMVSTDTDTDLKDYKVWLEPIQSEPISWTDYPAGLLTYTFTETFNVDVANSTPELHFKSRDFFENETYSILQKVIDPTPPTVSINTTGIANVISYSESGTTLSANLVATTNANTLVDKLEVEILHSTTSLETVEIDCGNVNTYSDVYSYVFSTNYNSTGQFKVHAYNDYGYKTSTTVDFSRAFDSTRPVVPSNGIEHLDSWIEPGTNDFVVKFRLRATDSGSGIKKVQFGQQGSSTVFDVPLTNTLDIERIVRYSSSTGTNTGFVEFRVFDLLGNVSVSFNVASFTLDWDAPSISAYSLFDGEYYVNTPNPNVAFTSTDLANVASYTFNSDSNKTYDSSWTDVAQVQTLNVDETINLDTMGYAETINTLYIYSRDRFGNIAKVSRAFMYDKTVPNVTARFLNYIERESGTNNFIVPYEISYNDATSGVWKVADDFDSTNPRSWHWTFNPVQMSNTVNTQIVVTESDYKRDVPIYVSAMDRASNISPDAIFNVYLENEAPDYSSMIINGGDTYTTDANVFVRMSATDDTGITEFLFSNVASETWDSTGWNVIPTGTDSSIEMTWGLDLESIGFTEGTCQVHGYLKDFCQNVGTANDTIVYDKTAPTQNTFFIDAIRRTPDFFEFDLVGDSWDDNSGINDWIISMSDSDTNWSTHGSPQISTSASPTQHTKTLSISVRENGIKYFYYKTKDAAGNESSPFSNTSVYIDSTNPVVISFAPTSHSYDPYYFSNSTHTFSYQVFDNRGVKRVGYRLDSNNVVNWTTTHSDPLNNNESGTFTLDCTALNQGTHVLYFIVQDEMQNQSEFQHTFFLDKNEPTINTFSLGLTRKSGTTFYSSLNIDISESDTELYGYEIKNGGTDLIPFTRTANNEITFNPTFTYSMGSNPTTLSIELNVDDIAGNRANTTITKVYTTTPPTISSFTIDGGASVTVSTANHLTTNRTFAASVSHSVAGVSLSKFALTVETSIDQDSGYWEDYTGSINESRPLKNFGIQTTSADLIYLHVMDDCGNIASSNITVNASTPNPRVSSITTGDFIRKGRYYEIPLTIVYNDSNNIEAYSFGYSSDPDEWISLPLSNSGTINKTIKIPESQIDGWEFIYLRVRDIDGNLSPNYRIPIKANDFDLEFIDYSFPLYTDNSSENCGLEIRTEEEDLEYMFLIDDDREPNSGVVWNAATLAINNIGDKTFNINVTGLNVLNEGLHDLYIWIRNNRNEVTYKRIEFYKESGAAPVVMMNVRSTFYRDQKKFVEIELHVKDDGVGFEEFYILKSTDTVDYTTINRTNEKKLLKVFEFDKTDTTTVNFVGRARDLVGRTSSIQTLSVDLSTVY